MNRSKVFVETKGPGCLVPVGYKPMLNPFDCYNATRKVLEDNLALLNTTYADLVLVHYPPIQTFIARSCSNLTGSCELVRAQWRATEEFYRAGKARAIGVSNYCPSCFECLKEASTAPMVNQLQYHVGMGVDPDGQMSFCKQDGCIVQARTHGCVRGRGRACTIAPPRRTAHWATRRLTQETQVQLFMFCLFSSACTSLQTRSEQGDPARQPHNHDRKSPQCEHRTGMLLSPVSAGCDATDVVVPSR